MPKQFIKRILTKSILPAFMLLLSSVCAYSQNTPRVDTIATQCSEAIIGKINFKAKTAYLNKAAYLLLDSIAANIRAYPACRVMVKTYLNEAGYFAQQLSWDRAYLITKYLIEKGGVSESRIIFSYEYKGNNTADISFSNRKDPSSIPPPPAPNFSILKHKHQ